MVENDEFTGMRKLTASLFFSIFGTFLSFEQDIIADEDVFLFS